MFQIVLSCFWCNWIFFEYGRNFWIPSRYVPHYNFGGCSCFMMKESVSLVWPMCSRVRVVSSLVILLKSVFFLLIWVLFGRACGYFGSMIYFVSILLIWIFSQLYDFPGFLYSVVSGMIWSFCYALVWIFTPLLCIHTYIHTYIKVKLVTVVEGDPKAPFSIATTPRVLLFSLDCSTLPLIRNL